MDVMNVFDGKLKVGSVVELSGWIVDRNGGLFLLADHFPLDFDFPICIEVLNSNVIYPILDVIPSLAGGLSSLFYRFKAIAAIKDVNGLKADINRISIQSNRNGGEFMEIDISKNIVDDFINRYGNYKFIRQRDPMRDWMD
jgi:hypothetical protein